MNIKQYEIFQNNDKLPYLKSILEFDSELAREMACFSNESYEIKLDIMRQFFCVQDFESEHLYVIASNSDGIIIGIYLVGIGNLSEVNLGKRSMYVFLLLVGAAKCMVVHNHPNDSLLGSNEDKICSNIYKNVLNNLGIEYEGSYIICKSGFSNCDTNEITTWKDWDLDKEIKINDEDNYTFKEV